MSQLSRRKFVTTIGGAVAGLAVGATIAKAVTTDSSQADTDAYAEAFLTQYNKIKDPSNGYFHSSGVPYHSVETLIVEAPDHGHQTTSEAFSYWVWLEAVYGRVSGDWAPFNSAWATLEKYAIPSTTDQPTNGSYNASHPADYIPEWPDPSKYPSEVDTSVPVGADPIAGELQSTYGTPEMYAMHWLMDVDNVYGYGNTAGSGAENGPNAAGPCYINSYQRGSQESVWETIPQPCTEQFAYGGPNGYLDLFVKDSRGYSHQWKYTNAPDADARAVQAAYWAHRWASEQGQADAVAATAAKAAKMGDYLRYAMFDKYFKEIGDCTSASGCPAGSGRSSQHYLMSWYFAWGGAEPGGGWAWRIGDGASHHGYQNAVAAWALSTVAEFAPRSASGTSDWATSLDRQIEFLTWLQSAEGAIAGGCTNSWDGQYGTPPDGTPTFYGMAYDWEPVYHDPPSNNWFGMQAWGMERWAEYYYLSKDSRVKAVLDKWVAWVTPLVAVGSGGSFSIPSTLSWSGQPDTWNPSTPGANASLHVSVTDSGQDVGVAAALAKALMYYAAATSDTTVQDVARGLLDALVANADSAGIGVPETRTDYNRFDDSVFVPEGWTGTMPNGDTIASDATFLSIRSWYREDPAFTKVQAYLDGGAAPTFTYHRFWAQADIAIALATYSELFLGGGTVTPSPTDTTTPSATATATATATPTATTTSPTPTPSGAVGLATSYQVWSDWQSGFVAQITITNNTSTTIHSWTVTWTFAGNQQVSNAWNSTVSQTGRSVTAANAGYNGTLAPGESASFGFLATYSGTNTAPSLSASGS